MYKIDREVFKIGRKFTYDDNTDVCEVIGYTINPYNKEEEMLEIRFDDGTKYTMYVEDLEDDYKWIK